MNKSNNSDSQEHAFISNVEEANNYIGSSKDTLPAPGSKVTPLLPPLEDAMKLLGFSWQLPSIVSLIVKEQELPLPFSRATLFKFPDFISGQLKLKKSTPQKLLNFLFESASDAPPFKVPIHPKGGAADTGWCGLIAGLKTSERKLTEGAYLLSFLEERVELENMLLKSLASRSPTEMEKFAIYVGFLSKHTLLSSESLNTLMAILSKRNGTISKQKKALYVCSSNLDFYFSAVACLEIGWLDRLLKESPEVKTRRPTLFQQGVISSFMRELSFENDTIKLKCPFELFLNWLAQKIGISNAKLASFIPLNRESDTINGYIKLEKQKDLLKDWKKSKCPSPEKLQNFIKNLRGESTGDAQFLTDIGFACIVLDKLVSKLFDELEVYNSKECYVALSECIARYGDYFHHYRAIYSKA